MDITLDLESKTYQNYRKPGDKPLYVSAWSNHPPQILKNIPKGIEQRLSDNSATEELFKQAVPPYQAELNRCGYKHKLKYNPKQARGPKKKTKTIQASHLVQPPL